jgi:hypothetical protein
LVASLLYLLFRRVLAVAALRLRSREFKELEIVVLRYELAVLRGTIRRDCLDWLLIASRRQLEHVLRVYVKHYNTDRPHRGLGLGGKE